VIDWGSFALVFLVALLGATVVVGLFATGLRLLAVDSDSLVRTRRLAAVSCFVLCGAAVLFGVALILPLPWGR
jgi:hypothetical protein